MRERLHVAADAAGRPREELGLEVWLATKDGDPDSWRAGVERWAALGATHLSVQTYADEPISPAEHIERVALIADSVIVPLGALACTTSTSARMRGQSTAAFTCGRDRREAGVEALGRRARARCPPSRAARRGRRRAR